MSTLHRSSIAGVPLQSSCSIQERVEHSTTSPRACVAVLLLADFAALAIGAGISILAWRHLGVDFSAEFYLRLWPLLLLFPSAYAASGLYPSFGRNPADELRKLSVATSVVYAALAVSVFLLKDQAIEEHEFHVIAPKAMLEGAKPVAEIRPTATEAQKQSADSGLAFKDLPSAVAAFEAALAKITA